jgi:hypothetical protein
MRLLFESERSHDLSPLALKPNFSAWRSHTPSYGFGISFATRYNDWCSSYYVCSPCVCSSPVGFVLTFLQMHIFSNSLDLEVRNHSRASEGLGGPLRAPGNRFETNWQHAHALTRVKHVCRRMLDATGITINAARFSRLSNIES